MTEHAHILIVEDDDLVRRSISLTLEEAGYRVTGAENCDKADRVLERGGISLIVTDVWMPGRSGIDWLKQCRDAGNDLPFIFISGGHAMEALELTTSKAAAHGVTRFIMKPFDDRELLEAVGDMLASPVTA